MREVERRTSLLLCQPDSLRARYDVARVMRQPTSGCGFIGSKFLSMNSRSGSSKMASRSEPPASKASAGEGAVEAVLRSGLTEHDQTWPNVRVT